MAQLRGQQRWADLCWHSAPARRGQGVNEAGRLAVLSAAPLALPAWLWLSLPTMIAIISTNATMAAATAAVIPPAVRIAASYAARLGAR